MDLDEIVLAGLRTQDKFKRDQLAEAARRRDARENARAAGAAIAAAGPGSSGAGQSDESDAAGPSAKSKGSNRKHPHCG